MIAMSPSIKLTGKINVTWKKLISRGSLGKSLFEGPGELLLAPSVLGDITVLRLDGRQKWKVGRDGFLAATRGVDYDEKLQNLLKAWFSGEGLWVSEFVGEGLLWIQSFGAIIRKDVSVHATGLPGSH